MKNIRFTIRKQVLNIKPFDNLEHEHISNVLQWIDSGAELFRIEKPDKPLMHLVSYFTLVDRINNSILLVDHIKAQLWLPTGGHVEPNEDPVETVKREITEELFTEANFLDGNTMPRFVTVTQTVGLTAGHTDVSLWFALVGHKDVLINYDEEEFNNVKWFTYDEVLEMPIAKLDPHLHRYIRKLISEK